MIARTLLHSWPKNGVLRKTYAGIQALNPRI